MFSLDKEESFFYEMVMSNDFFNWKSKKNQIFNYDDYYNYQLEISALAIPVNAPVLINTIV